MSLPAFAVGFQIIYVTLLLLQGLCHIIFEEVILYLKLLDCVRCLLVCGGLGMVDSGLLSCEVDSSFDAEGGC